MWIMVDSLKDAAKVIATLAVIGLFAWACLIALLWWMSSPG